VEPRGGVAARGHDELVKWANGAQINEYACVRPHSSTLVPPVFGLANRLEMSIARLSRASPSSPHPRGAMGDSANDASIRGVAGVFCWLLAVVGRGVGRRKAKNTPR
jgi:hypothetical protein